MNFINELVQDVTEGYRAPIFHKCLSVTFRNESNIRHIKIRREITCVKPETTLLKNIITTKVPKQLIKARIKTIRSGAFIRMHGKHCQPEFFLCKWRSKHFVVFHSNGLADNIKDKSRGTSMFLKYF
jgi:hypothetical protein